MSSEIVNRAKGVLGPIRPKFSVDTIATGGRSDSLFKPSGPITPPGEFFAAISGHSSPFVERNAGVVVHRAEHSKVLPKPDMGEEENSERVKPPPWVRKFGDLVGNGIYSAMTGTDMVRPFADRSKSLKRIGYELALLNLKDSTTYPTVDHLITAADEVGRQAVEFLSKRDKGKVAVNLIEPSFAHSPARFHDSAETVNELVEYNRIDPAIALIAGESFATTDEYLRSLGDDQIDEADLAHLRLLAGPASIFFDPEEDQYHLVNQGIRPDFLRFTYKDTPENGHLKGLLNGLEQIKKGKGVRQNLLDFPYWVDSTVDVDGQLMLAQDVVRQALIEVVKGNLTLNIGEIKNHINGHYLMTGRAETAEEADRLVAHVQAENKEGRSPYVSMDVMDGAINRDAGTTSLHLFNFAINFLPELRHQEVFEGFLANTHMEIYEASHDMVQHNAHSTVEPYPEELTYPIPTLIVYQVKHEDLVREWGKRRNRVIRHYKRTEHAAMVREHGPWKPDWDIDEHPSMEPTEVFVASDVNGSNGQASAEDIRSIRQAEEEREIANNGHKKGNTRGASFGKRVVLIEDPESKRLVTFTQDGEITDEKVTRQGRTTKR